MAGGRCSATGERADNTVCVDRGVSLQFSLKTPYCVLRYWTTLPIGLDLLPVWRYHLSPQWCVSTDLLQAKLHQHNVLIDVRFAFSDGHRDVVSDAKGVA